MVNERGLRDSQDSLLPAAVAEPEFEGFSIGVKYSIHGAGSTTLAETLAKILGLPHVYAGKIMRQKAVSAGYATSLDDEAGLLRYEGEKVTPEIDRQIDHEVVTQARQGCVFEGPAAVMLSETDELVALNPKCLNFVILLTCGEQQAAKRVLTREEIKNPTNAQISQKIEDLRKRQAENIQNWVNAYGGGDLIDPVVRDRAEQTVRQRLYRHYDLKIDTTHLNQDQVVAEILNHILKNKMLSPLLSAEQRKTIKILSKILKF